VPPGTSVGPSEHRAFTVVTGAMVGVKEAYGCIVGQSPGQPRRFRGSVPSTLWT
jgi:hypothetical protein